ncbi:MAG: hypothetical protein KC421_06130 [Anaerolineales bacterium]|nr:hypothetical protein [Anaerolineales bacterium]
MNRTSKPLNSNSHRLRWWQIFTGIGIIIAFILLFQPAGVFGQTEPVTILPLGDSITEGDTTYNSYRRALWFMLQDAGYNVDFIGSEVNNSGGPAPDQDFDLDHEGHAGWRADQIVDNGLATWLESYTPDIVLLHIGSNDLTRVNRNNVVVQGTLNDTAEIIAVLRADNPNVTVLLAQLIPSCTNILSDNIVTYNQELPAFAAQQSEPNSPVILVDQFTGFDAQTDTHDCVHPNVPGEQKMAQKWFDTLASLLGSGSTPAPTATNTAVSPTNTPGPTATPTNTAVPPTSTPTNLPPTATNTPLPPTSTPTNTAVPPTPTATATNVPGSCNGKIILFVGRSDPLLAVDQTLADYLTGLGHTVVVRSERDATAADAVGKDLIIVSDSVNSRRIGTKFRDTAVSFMTWESGLYDDMQMTAASFADWGFESGQTAVTITNGTHPLAAGLSGVVTVLNSNGDIFWGHPTAGAIEIATDSSDTHPVLFAYETGADMIDLTAPARRLGFFSGSGESFTTEGWQLFDAGVTWAMGCSQ